MDNSGETGGADEGVVVVEEVSGVGEISGWISSGNKLIVGLVKKSGVLEGAM